MQTMCPNCHGKGKIKEEWIGKKIKCPNCAEMFEVQPFEEKPEPAPSRPARREAPSPPVPPTAPPFGQETVGICSQCGASMPESELIDFDGILVCASCKALYLQKMREGVSPLDLNFEYAGFWVRFSAKFIDGIITGLVSLLIAFGLAFLIGTAGGGEGLVAVLNNLLSIMIGVGYSTWFVGKYGATPGKMAHGLKIVKPDGAQLTYKQAFGRYCGELLSYIILGIGYIMVAFDDEKRGLHDRICETRVIRTR